MLSLVVCGLPICLPLALAFAIPDRTLALHIANSNWLNTPAICKKASLIGSALPSRQSSVILPIITNRRRFSRTRSMISHSFYNDIRSFRKRMIYASRMKGTDIISYGIRRISYRVSDISLNYAFVFCIMKKTEMRIWLRTNCWRCHLNLQLPL